jgi:polyhydroxyalkanoate synthesis regulator phasin
MATKDKVQSFARNVWLAGLGAYGKGSESLTKKLDQTYEQSNQLFNDLVSRGTEIQATIEAKIKEQSLFETKVDEVREKLGLTGGVTDQQIEELTAKVDTLTTIVTQMAERRLAEQEASTADGAVVTPDSAEQSKEDTSVNRTRKTKAKADTAADTES